MGGGGGGCMGGGCPPCYDKDFLMTFFAHKMSVLGVGYVYWHRLTNPLPLFHFAL